MKCFQKTHLHLGEKSQFSINKTKPRFVMTSVKVVKRCLTNLLENGTNAIKDVNHLNHSFYFI